MAHPMNRREMISGALLAGAVGASAQTRTGLTTVAATPRRMQDPVLVILFLRGGADGLSIVPPVGDPDYARLRPTLALPAPTDRRAPVAARCVPLDDRFGLHPSLRMLEGLYREGRMGAVHAVGSGDQSRSHFEAMAVMERGLSGTTEGPSGGWLARALAATETPEASPVRALAFTETMPDTLRGAGGASVMRSLTEFRLRGGMEARQSLAGLYGSASSDADYRALLNAGRGTLAVMDAIAALDAISYEPARGAVYPPGPVGDGFRQTACLIKGDLGLEAAFLDMTGWDTHVAQGRDSGWMPSRLDELGRALAAFALDLGTSLQRVTCIVMTEFGRRAYENSGLGTDHGRASCMLAIGAGVAGGRVHGRWPGLGRGALESPGDLAVTTDYRAILTEVLTRTLGPSAARAAFPGYAHVPIGVVTDRKPVE